MTADGGGGGVEDRVGRPPSDSREKLLDAENVTGAEFVPPHDLDGYLDEPTAKFGLWVGDDADDAELRTFEINGDQIDGFAEAFGRLAEDAAALDDDE